MSREAGVNDVRLFVTGLALGSLLLGTLGVLVWREYTDTAESETGYLAAGYLSAVHLAAVRPVCDSPVHRANEGKLIYLTGEPKLNEVVSDSFFKIAPPGAITVKRTVEAFTDESEGGHPASEHRPRWVEHLSKSPPLESKITTASRIQIGAFTISKELASRMTEFEPVYVPRGPVPDLGGRAGVVHDGAIYYGDPAAPKRGDLRVRFSAVAASQITVAGKQHGVAIEPFDDENGDSFGIVRPGAVSMEALMQSAAQAPRLGFVQLGEVAAVLFSILGAIVLLALILNRSGAGGNSSRLSGTPPAA